MADSDLDTLHEPFVLALEQYQHNAVLVPLTVSDLVGLAGTLQAILRMPLLHPPPRQGLARILQHCLTQLDTIDPVLRQWLERYGEVFTFETAREAEP